jgi:RNA polymerase sigma-70 factor (ECF subfamily)
MMTQSRGASNAKAKRELEGKLRFEASRKEREVLARRFFEAVGDGDMDGLVELLAADVVAYGHGGGKGPSWLRPIYGRERVVRPLLGVSRQARDVGVTMRRAEINGQPGALIFDPSGLLIDVMTLDIADGSVQTLRSVVNPEKLGHLGPLADVRGLLSQRTADRQAGSRDR